MFRSLRTLFIIIVLGLSFFLWQDAKNRAKKTPAKALVVKAVGQSAKNALIMLKDVPKCSLEDEKILCDAFVLPFKGPYGVSKRGNLLVVMVKALPYEVRAKELQPADSVETENYLATIVLLKEGLKPIEKIPKARILIFEFYNASDSDPKLKFIFGIKPDHLLKIQQDLGELNLTNPKDLALAIEMARKSYSITKAEELGLKQ